LKSELVWRTVFHTRAQAKTAIARYIDGFYNPTRRHSALNFLSPAQFENAPYAETMPVCLENLDSDVMVMKSAENGARGHSAKMLDRAS
jgi:hypothetical protein